MVSRPFALLLGVALVACARADTGRAPALDSVTSADEPTSLQGLLGTPGGKLSATALQVNVFERPQRSSKKLGYLRLGGSVTRSGKPAGTDGCPGGWYAIAPRGYACAGDEATTDENDPLARAGSAVRADPSKPLPYAYGFVRAVSPLYLRVPTAAEQTATEYKLQNHLAWFGRHSKEANKVVLGANDVAIDSRGVAIDGKTPPRLSIEMGPGELLGAKSDGDPLPFWLDGGRKIANVSSFQVPLTSFFANRVRRHTGLALVGSFATGPEALDRRFAVTVDLRLVPADKIKPETGSAFHGVEVSGDLTLPLAFVRSACESERTSTCAHAFRMEAGRAHRDTHTLPWRSVVPLSGADKKLSDVVYRETRDGLWVRGADVAIAMVPSDWPAEAKNGEKWIDVSIEQQTLVLWEGKKPVYATLVSTGQDGMEDPKTTKSTVRGVFRIKNKHITATMDSERTSEGGVPSGNVKVSAAEAKDDDKPRRRGEGLFELRDVPYVAYFEAGYALHGAYWHDVFGTARSHGCINLSPVDAHRVFSWTDPPVPEGWHGVVAGGAFPEGTTVVVHR